MDVPGNTAGIRTTASLTPADRATRDMARAVTLSAAVHTMRRALPGMEARGFGWVMNIASVHGLVASVGKSPCVASTFRLVGIGRVAALEHAAAGNRERGGVTVSCICPRWTGTAIVAAQIEARAAAAGSASLLAGMQPTRRTSTPAGIVARVLWLCAPVAHNLTGTAIPVDGNWTAQ